MSWDGFKKAINRAGGNILVKPVDKVVDRDYEIEERRFRTLEKAGLALQTSTKAYLDLLRAVTASQLLIAEIVDHLYADAKVADPAHASTGEYYLKCVTEFDEETVKQLDGPFRETVLEPVTRFAIYFNEVNEAIKKRDHKKTDLEQCKSKVRRLIDKPAKDAAKLPRAEKELAMAKEIYDQLNGQLKTELPQLINMRIPWYDPLFEALVKIQIRFSTEGYTRLAQVQQVLDPASRDQYVDGALDQQIDGLLAEMNNLTICGLGK